jgi:hypothetical protein
MKILLAILLVLVFSVGTVSADIEYFNGVPIDMPEDPDEYAKCKEFLETYGPPPPPPDWPFDAPEPVVKTPITYKNQDSGPAIEDAIESDWTGQDYWLWT